MNLKFIGFFDDQLFTIPLPHPLQALPFRVFPPLPP